MLTVYGWNVVMVVMFLVVIVFFDLLVFFLTHKTISCSCNYTICGYGFDGSFLMHCCQNKRIESKPFTRLAHFCDLDYILLTGDYFQHHQDTIFKHVSLVG